MTVPASGRARLPPNRRSNPHLRQSVRLGGSFVLSAIALLSQKRETLFSTIAPRSFVQRENTSRVSTRVCEPRAIVLRVVEDFAGVWRKPAQPGLRSAQTPGYDDIDLSYRVMISGYDTAPLGSWANVEQGAESTSSCCGGLSDRAPAIPAYVRIFRAGGFRTIGAGRQPAGCALARLRPIEEPRTPGG